MSHDMVPVPPRRDLARAGIGTLPAMITCPGEKATWRFVEFFTANIRNRNTRGAYAQAVTQFFRSCEARDFHDLEKINPVMIGTYIEQHPGSPPTVKQHLSAIRMLFDWLVVGQTIPMNPASSVRGPKHVVKRGKTPVLKADQARARLDSIETDPIVGLRDRALLGLNVLHLRACKRDRAHAS
jgi:integrase/recombinase XerD